VNCLNPDPRTAIGVTADKKLVLFVCGKKSSNGRNLFNECVDANPNSHLISNENDIDPHWLDGISSVGICGATSTPRWLMTQVKEHIEFIVHS
jgi:4-hydroxy-3-methylbut-2-enyl diphosphate reductase